MCLYLFTNNRSLTSEYFLINTKWNGISLANYRHDLGNKRNEILWRTLFGTDSNESYENMLRANVPHILFCYERWWIAYGARIDKNKQTNLLHESARGRNLRKMLTKDALLQLNTTKSLIKLSLITHYVQCHVHYQIYLQLFTDLYGYSITHAVTKTNSGWVS